MCVKLAGKPTGYTKHGNVPSHTNHTATDAEAATPEDVLSGRSARERLRIVVDKAFAAVMAIGGIAVIIAISLIFLYLFYVVLPLFQRVQIENGGRVEVGERRTLHTTLDEYAEIVLSVGDDGSYRFRKLADGVVLEEGRLLDEGQAALALRAGDLAARTLFVATAGGRVQIARADYSISYPDDRRLVTPSMSFPLGEDGLEVDPEGRALRLVAGQNGEEQTTIAGVTEDGRVVLIRAETETSFLGDEVTTSITHAHLPIDGGELTHLLINVEQREFYVADSVGFLSLYDISDMTAISLVDRAPAASPGARVTALESLAGGISILVGDDKGALSQWFPVRDSNNEYSLAKVREFESMATAVRHIASEYFRKSFAAVDDNGDLALYHTTAERRVLDMRLAEKSVRTLALSPRADAALITTAAGSLQHFTIDNEHPEVSLSALWQEVWYESRSRPEYIWQSSSASSDFEPKFSLTPLTFGTLKATFYSMLFATPLAILGAIYTAYFMTPAMRSIVKPSVEVMAALPTVILGFLAGLWLAPLLERELLGFLLAVPLVPLVIVAAAWLWTRLPSAVRALVPDGWEALLLVPVICVGAWFSVALGSAGEVLFFNGSLPQWLTAEYGITYDQRNSLVVGIAIGFAVIPTIFSISEDAVFSVPRSLTMGSLALGATPWQTALRVVLLTASPGIFSAVMIGMGRAVGETMIVLMATGNTPIMDLNIFQGFRALSANIAVEMPESEVDSTHYRILFLAALVLFLVTFFVNTLAEVVRQRLRRKYASL